ncbi:MAG: response regulator [Arcobacteraceae bacterium]|jgi:DNA-binding response OmpR family regulator|nr:response regulator [Arcobacteraceae bacterium]
MNIKIYIVEDEVIVAIDLKKILENIGYEVCGIATNYDQAFKEINLLLPDIILMDINLKNSKSGIELATDIKLTHDISVIYLTAYSDADTLSKAINTDPVGYINKPFNIVDIYTTIELGLYKSKNNPLTIDSQDVINLGYGYSYYKKHNHIQFGDKVIKLGEKEFTLLKILINAKGKIVTYPQIEYEIWPEGVSANNVLRSLIYRLRTKIDPKIIENVHSIGCKLNKFNP